MCIACTRSIHAHPHQHRRRVRVHFDDEEEDQGRSSGATTPALGGAFAVPSSAQHDEWLPHKDGGIGSGGVRHIGGGGLVRSTMHHAHASYGLPRGGGSGLGVGGSGSGLGVVLPVRPPEPTIPWEVCGWCVALCVGGGDMLVVYCMYILYVHVRLCMYMYFCVCMAECMC